MRGKSPQERATGERGRWVGGCVQDSRARKRVEAALRGHATLEWFESFAHLREALDAHGRMSIVIVGLRDGQGESASGFALSVRGAAAGTAIVACCEAHEKLQSISELAVAGVHDVLFSGINDDPHSARMIIFGACLGGAADSVMHALGSTVPAALGRFVDLAIRRPRELRRVAEVAAALNVPRQTIGRWCRVNAFLGPEELLMWIRLLLVTAMLEATDRTLESIAYDLQYGSPTALRNRIREYTGLTATQLRQDGLRQMMSAFLRRIDEVRRESEEGKRGRPALTG